MDRSKAPGADLRDRLVLLWIAMVLFVSGSGVSARGRGTSVGVATMGAAITGAAISGSATISLGSRGSNPAILRRSFIILGTQ